MVCELKAPQRRAAGTYAPPRPETGQDRLAAEEAMESIVNSHGSKFET